jgi:restriction system protein
LQGRSDLSAKIDVLLSLGWRDFEFLIARLYVAQGYDVEVTPGQKDRGKDVIARRPSNEVVFIECKNWRGRVDAGVVVELVGRVDIERATRGVIVATSGFTTGRASAAEVAAQMATRISLIGGDELVQTMNTHLGADWALRVDRIIDAQKRSETMRA